MRILLLSPYDALSHQYWRRALVESLPEHEFEVITLPPRYFSWRFRGNSMTMAHDSRMQQSFDLLIATSMTDLSALKGMCSSIAGVPSILYFHENQFAYPDAGDRNHLTERQVTSLYAAIAADCLVFNSEFNQTTFLAGVKALLKKLPDGIPAGVAQSLAAKSRVISVGLSDLRLPAIADKAQQFSIVWNHRWEHDKGLTELEAVVSLLLETGLAFEFHLIGQAFRTIPPEIARVRNMLEAAGKIGRCGFIEGRGEYLALLDSSHVVLSTARHEFQGLSVLEAIQAGCVPVVPDDLAYKEFIALKHRYTSSKQAVDMIQQASQQKPAGVVSIPRQVTWAHVQASWRKLIHNSDRLP